MAGMVGQPRRKGLQVIGRKPALRYHRKQVLKGDLLKWLHIEIVGFGYLHSVVLVRCGIVVQNTSDYFTRVGPTRDRDHSNPWPPAWSARIQKTAGANAATLNNDLAHLACAEGLQKPISGQRQPFPFHAIPQL